MAHRLESFDFTVEQRRNRHTFPLDQWLDGSIWEIVQGQDFTGTCRNMQARLHHYARQHGGRVDTRSVHEPDRKTVIFRFTCDPVRQRNSNP